MKTKGLDELDKLFSPQIENLIWEMDLAANRIRFIQTADYYSSQFIGTFLHHHLVESNQECATIISNKSDINYFKAIYKHTNIWDSFIELGQWFKHRPTLAIRDAIRSNIKQHQLLVDGFFEIFNEKAKSSLCPLQPSLR